MTEKSGALIDAEMADQEARFGQFFADAVDASGDVDEIFEYITFAVAELDYELSADVKDVIDRARNNQDDWLLIVPEANETYAGKDVQDSIQEICDDIEHRTRDRRREALGESVPGVDVTVTIKVVLSGGGPADWLKAEMDPVSRAIGSVEYHYLQAGDGTYRDVPENSPLWQLAEYCAETALVP